MVLIEELTKRGKDVYFQLMQYLIEEEDFLRAFIMSVEADFERHNSFKIDLLYWVSFNVYFTLEEQQLINAFIDKFGILPVGEAVWFIYKKYRTKDILNQVGLKREVPEREILKGDIE